MQLYNYFRSSASFRVRIALELKGLTYEYLPIHLLKNEQLQPEFRHKSPDGLVPVLVDGTLELTQSLAICEYLDETHPEPALLPGDALGRARVRALAYTIACEIHPLNNLRVMRYLAHELELSDEAKDTWYRHWVESGLLAFERELELFAPPARYCFGDQPTLADICLVPQIFNGQRVNSDFSKVPRVMRVFDACMELEAFRKAAPERQPDAT
jgi:maleylpyruvate isomerase